MKNIEKKFKEWHECMPCENYHPYYFIFEAGYEIAKREYEMRLKEAEDALKFYSFHLNWYWDDLSYAFNIIDVNDLGEVMDAGSEIGGKRAREYFKKWSKE